VAVVRIYTQTIHRTTQTKMHRTINYRRKTIHRTTQFTNCELYPGICLTTAEKGRKTSVRVTEEYQLALEVLF